MLALLEHRRLVHDALLPVDPVRPLPRLAVRDRLMRSPKVPETAENTSCSSRKGTLPTRRMGVRASLIQSSSFLYRFGPGSGKVQHFQLLCWSQDRSLPDFRAHPRAGTGSAELRHSGFCLSSIRNFVGAPGERGAPHRSDALREGKEGVSTR